MSPLIVAPNRGYSDEQRVVNYDSGILSAIPATQSTGVVGTGVLDVSRFAYLGGKLTCTQNYLTVNCQWWNDQNQTVLVGWRFFTMNTSIGPNLFWRLPNLGPFVTISFNSISSVQYTIAAELFGTNRVHPLEFIPVQPILVDSQSFSFGANTLNQFYPTDYYAGPVSVWTDIITGSALVGMNWFSTTANWDFTAQTQAVLSPGGVVVYVAPPGAWRITLNAGASGAAGLIAVTPSTTGAI